MRLLSRPLSVCLSLSLSLCMYMYMYMYMCICLYVSSGWFLNHRYGTASRLVHKWTQCHQSQHVTVRLRLNGADPRSTVRLLPGRLWEAYARGLGFVARHCSDSTSEELACGVIRSPRFASILLMTNILHDCRYQNHRISGSRLYTGRFRIHVINSVISWTEKPLIRAQEAVL